MASDPPMRPAGGETSPQPVVAVPAPRLELLVLDESGARVDRTFVTDTAVVRLGSHPSNDVVLEDARVSRFHCRLVRTPTAWRLEDSGSLNGTVLDTVTVRDADLPARDCVLQLGQSRVRVRSVAAVHSTIVPDRASCGDLYGTSLPMRELFGVIDRVAATTTNVLVQGESGTGKELVASEIVRRGPRARKPFVIVDCGAISPALIESELFGHVRGAFTGADRDRIGAFEAADGGTVFLDELGELPLELQPKLLRVLESREIRPVGAVKSRQVDVRVIAATNRVLEREVNRQRFREDLFFRLSVITLRVPPLRERPEDLDLLVNVFLDSLGAPHAKALFTPEVMETLRQHDWPGNVRELRNYVERTVVFREAGSADARTGEPDLAAPAEPPTGALAEVAPVDLDVSFRTAKEQAIAAFERRYIGALLAWAQNNMARAARRARMDRMNLYRLVQRHGFRERSSLKE